MNELQFALTPERVVHFMLIGARLGGVFASAPVFGHRSTPMRVRTALTVAIALALTHMTPPGRAAEITGAWELGGAVLLEVMTGVMIGILPQLVIGGVMLGGQMAGIHMGLGMARLVDPVTQVQVTPIALWFQFLAMLVFLTLDVHHLIVRAVAHSLVVAPPGTLEVGPAQLGAVLSVVGDAFEVGLRIAAPVLGGLLIIDTAMGLLARAIPELNVFIMGFAVKIGVGFFILSAALPFAVRFLQQRFVDLEPTLLQLVGSLG